MHTITKNNRSIPITGVEAETITNEPLFMNWLDTVDPSWIIHSIEFQSVDRTLTSGRILFIKIKVDVEHAEGRMPNMVVLIRSNAVAALTVLTCEDKQYVLLVDQPRIPTGHIISEAVAGLMDGEADPRAVILRELEEEAHAVTRLGITLDNVISLSDKPFYLSPGVLTESVYPFLVEHEVDRSTLETYQGIKRGLVEEYESITVRIVELEEVAAQCNNAITLAMLHLYDRYLAAK